MNFQPGMWGRIRAPNRLDAIWQIAVPILVGALLGGIILLDLSLQYVVLFIGALGLVTVLTMVQQPTRVTLGVMAFVMPLSIGKSILVNSVLRLPVSSVGVQIYDILTIILLVLCLGRLAWERAFKFHCMWSTTAPALLWLGAGFLSLANAQDWESASIELITLVKLFVMYLVVANSIRAVDDAKWIMGGLIGGLAFEALLGVYQGVTGNYAGLSWLGEGEEVIQYNLAYALVNRCEGTVCHPNGLSMYLNTALPFLAAVLVSRARNVYKAGALMLLALGLLAMVMTLSRGGWLGLVIAFGTIMVMAVVQRRIRFGKATFVGLLLLGIACVVLLSGPNLVTNRLTLDDRRSAASRITMAQGAMAIIQDYPAVGAGINNYTLYLRTYDPATWQENQGLYVVHNVFLLVGAETGIVGLVGFTWLIVGVMLYAWRTARRAVTDAVWITGVAILAGYLALSAHGMGDFALIGCPRVLTQFWMLAGVAAGFAQLTRAAGKGEKAG